MDDNNLLTLFWAAPTPPWAFSIVKGVNQGLCPTPKKGDRAGGTHLYCCLESHLPAFVSRSLVARTLIILIKRIKFTCEGKNTNNKERRAVKKW